MIITLAQTKFSLKIKQTRKMKVEMDKYELKQKQIWEGYYQKQGSQRELTSGQGERISVGRQGYSSGYIYT